ncbi:carboxypeptidase-like regulatory domain-containing protein [Geojedonia litorea]|uniref:Carboxypeptidase-like regulatory domain-containing protein n=1 Tax=Geojedonia litorea TaxID=1268269 RepID=A0ABV9N2G7_9FLAO
MSKRELFKCICLYFFLCLNALSAQNVQDKQLLTKVLKDLEIRYDCNFSYSNEDLQDITLVPPSEELSFINAIEYLKNNTSLIFNVLQDRIVTIVSPNDFIFSVCGTILDKETQHPITGATVITGKQYTISDDFGRFQFTDIKVGAILDIKHIGYENRNVTIIEKPENCLILQLAQNVQELNEVVIPNFITQGIKKTAEGAITIDYNQFGVLPGLIDTDALQTVQSLPGINSLDETVTNINIRGGSHDQNLITWNNIKMYQTGHFFNLISAFNPNMTNKVALYKNGTPSGLSDGVSGTIDIKSSDRIATEFKASLGLNLIEVNGLVDIPISKNASLQISGRRSYSDLVKTHTSDHYFEKAFQNTEVFKNENNVISENDNFRFFDIEAVLNYDITENDKLKVGFITMKNDFSFFESAFILNEEESKESTSEQSNMGIGLNYSHIWNDKFNTTLNIYGLQYNLKAKNVDILNEKQLVQENSIDETEFTIASNYKLNEIMHLNGGYSFNESGIYNFDESNNPLFRIFSKDVIRKHALFTSLKLNSTSYKTQLTLGLRINYIQPFDEFIIEPRLSFNQKFLGVFTWDVLGEFKHQTNTQSVDLQNDFLGVENRRWVASNNRDVPIIKSKQLSTGVTYKENEWLINLEIFYKDVKGIVAQSQEFQNQYQFRTDSGSYSGSGIDVFISKKIKAFSLWGSYSYQDLNYHFKTLQQSRFPNNFNINNALNLGASYNYNNFKIATGLKWNTGRAITNPVKGNEVIDNEINYEPANTSNLPDYFRWDGSLTYDFKINKTILVNTGISLWNITDKSNLINKYYEFTDINFPIEIIDNSLEFTTNFLLRVTF